MKRAEETLRARLGELGRLTGGSSGRVQDGVALSGGGLVGKTEFGGDTAGVAVVQTVSDTAEAAVVTATDGSAVHRA